MNSIQSSATGATVADPSAAGTPPVVPAARLVGVLALRPVLILAAGLALLLAHVSLIWTNLLVIPIDLVSLLVVHRAMRAEGGSLRDLIGPWRWSQLAWGALVSVILVVTFFVSSFAANLVVYGGAPPMGGTAPRIPLWFALIGVVLMPATIALAEECVYRGYAQPRLARRTGTAVAVVVVALVFGLQHVGFTLTDPSALAAKVITTALSGLVLGLLLLWLRRLMPLVIGHWALDLLGLGLPMLLLVG